MITLVQSRCQDDAGNWQKPNLIWPANTGGIYTLAHKIVRDGDWRTDDNKFMGDVQADAIARNMKYGLFIEPDGVKVSYAKCMMDLASKVGTIDNKRPGDPTHTLLPAIIIGAWSVYTAGQLEGDFFNYFESVMLAKFDNVVLGLNMSSLGILLNAGSNKILQDLTNPAVRIWYFRPNLSYTDAMTEFTQMLDVKGIKNKVPWIVMETGGVIRADLGSPLPPVHNCAVDEHWDDALGKCVKNASPVVDDNITIADHLLALSILFRARGTPK